MSRFSSLSFKMPITISLMSALMLVFLLTSSIFFTNKGITQSINTGFENTVGGYADLFDSILDAQIMVSIAYASSANIRNFLISTIWLNFLDSVSIDPINEYNIIRTEEVLDILFDKNNNFKEYKINFKEYLDEFIKKSKILTNEKTAQELYDKINIKKDSLIKKEQNKFNKINSKEAPNFEKILNLFNNIKIILQSTEKDEEKLRKFLQLIKNKYFIENN